jgi:hypothetical protein
LEELELKFTPDFQGQDLSALGLLPKLKKLILTRQTFLYGANMPTLKTLDGLQANQLEYFSAPHMSLQDISALTKCTKLAHVILSGNSEMTSIDALRSSANSLKEVDLNWCKNLLSIGALREAIHLEHLQISGLNQIIDLRNLEKLDQLQSLDFSNCEKLESLSGIPLHTLTSTQLGGKPSSCLYLNNMKSLESLDGMPALSHDIVEFSVNGAKALKNIDGLKASANSVKILKISEAQITDLSTLISLVH